MYQNVRFCPSCLKDSMKVVDSRVKKGTIWRRKTCLECGMTVKTLELYEEDVEQIMSQEFLYKKLLTLHKMEKDLLEGIGE